MRRIVIVRNTAIGLLIASVGAMAFGREQAAAITTSGGLEFLAPDKVAVHPDKNHEATTVATLRNNGPAIAKGPTFMIVGEGVATVTSTPSKFGGFTVQRFKLNFELAPGSDSAKGELVVRAPHAPPAAVPFDLSAEESAPSWVRNVIFIPLGAAILVVVIAYLIVLPRCGLAQRLGPADWDFSKSWASNLTVFSALLGTILSAGVLPKETSATKTATYAGLNLLFGVGVLMGPFLYTAFQSPVLVNLHSSEKEAQYQGRVWTFLLATILTLWAVLGELATIWALFGELKTANSLPDGGLWVFRILLAVGAVSLLVLILIRMHTILLGQCDQNRRRSRKKGQHQKLQALGVTGLTEGDTVPPLEGVPVY